MGIDHDPRGRRRCRKCGGFVHLVHVEASERGETTRASYLECGVCRRRWPAPGHTYTPEEISLLWERIGWAPEALYAAV